MRLFRPFKTSLFITTSVLTSLGVSYPIYAATVDVAQSGNITNNSTWSGGSYSDGMSVRYTADNQELTHNRSTGATFNDVTLNGNTGCSIHIIDTNKLYFKNNATVESKITAFSSVSGNEEVKHKGGQGALVKFKGDLGDSTSSDRIFDLVFTEKNQTYEAIGSGINVYPNIGTSGTEHTGASFKVDGDINFYGKLGSKTTAGLKLTQNSLVKLQTGSEIDSSVVPLNSGTEVRLQGNSVFKGSAIGKSATPTAVNFATDSTLEIAGSSDSTIYGAIENSVGSSGKGVINFTSSGVTNLKKIVGKTNSLKRIDINGSGGLRFEDSSVVVNNITFKNQTGYVEFDTASHYDNQIFVINNDNLGMLRFAQNATLSDNPGGSSSSKRLHGIIVDNGSTLTIDTLIHLKELHIKNSGDILSLVNNNVAAGDINAEDVKFFADGILRQKNAISLNTLDNKTAADDKGIFEIKIGGTVTGKVGDTRPLNEIRVNGGSSLTQDFNNTVKAKNFVIKNNSHTINLAGDNTNIDKVDFNSTSSTVNITGQYGSISEVVSSGNKGVITSSKNITITDKLQGINEFIFNASKNLTIGSASQNNGPEIDLTIIKNSNVAQEGSVQILGKSAGFVRKGNFGNNSAPLGDILDGPHSQSSNMEYTGSIYFNNKFEGGYNNTNTANLILNGANVTSESGLLTANNNIFIKNTVALTASTDTSLIIEDGAKLNISDHNNDDTVINSDIDSGNKDASYGVNWGSDGVVALKNGININGSFGANGKIKRLDIDAAETSIITGQAIIGSGGVKFNQDGVVKFKGSNNTIEADVINNTGLEHKGTIEFQGSSDVRGQVRTNTGTWGSSLILNGAGDGSTIVSVTGTASIYEFNFKTDDKLVANNNNFSIKDITIDPSASGTIEAKNNFTVDNIGSTNTNDSLKYFNIGAAFTNNIIMRETINIKELEFTRNSGLTFQNNAGSNQVKIGKIHGSTGDAKGEIDLHSKGNEIIGGIENVKYLILHNNNDVRFKLPANNSNITTTYLNTIQGIYGASDGTGELLFDDTSNNGIEIDSKIGYNQAGDSISRLNKLTFSVTNSENFKLKGDTYLKNNLEYGGTDSNNSYNLVIDSCRVDISSGGIKKATNGSDIFVTGSSVIESKILGLPNIVIDDNSSLSFTGANSLSIDGDIISGKLDLATYSYNNSNLGEVIFDSPVDINGKIGGSNTKINNVKIKDGPITVSDYSEIKNLEFNSDSKITFESGANIGPIDNITGNPDKGKLELSDDSTITGDIGASNKINQVILNKSDFATSFPFYGKINAASIDITSKSHEIEVRGDNTTIYGITTYLGNKGKVKIYKNITLEGNIGSSGFYLSGITFYNDKTLTLNNNSEIYSSISGDSTNTGELVVSEASKGYLRRNVNSNIRPIKIEKNATLSLGEAATTRQVSTDIHATGENAKIEIAGNIEFSDDSGHNIGEVNNNLLQDLKFTGSHELIVRGGSDVNTSISTSTPGNGIVTLKGGNSINGDIAQISKISVNTSSKSTFKFYGASQADTIEIKKADHTLEFYGSNIALNTITTDQNLRGKLHLFGNVTINKDTQKLNEVRIFNNSDLNIASGKLVKSRIFTNEHNTGNIILNSDYSFNHNVGEADKNLDSIIIKNDSTAKIENGSTIHASFATDESGKACVEVNGNMTLNCDIGSEEKKLKKLKFLGDYTVTVPGDSNIYAPVHSNGNNKGVLVLKGNTILDSDVGEPNNHIKQLRVEKDKTLTLNKGDIYANITKPTTTNENSTKIVIKGDRRIYSDIGSPNSQFDMVKFDGDHILRIGKNNSLYSKFRTSVANTGTLILEGNNTILQNIGTKSNPLKQLKIIGEENFELKDEAVVHADIINETINKSKLFVSSNSIVTGDIGSKDIYFEMVKFKGDYSLRLEGDATIYSPIKTDSNNSGSVIIEGDRKIFNDLGDANKRLKSVSILGSSSLTLTSRNNSVGEVHADIIAGEGKGKLKIEGEQKITGDIGTQDSNLGELRVLEKSKLTLNNNPKIYGNVSLENNTKTTLNGGSEVFFKLDNKGLIKLSSNSNLDLKDEAIASGDIKGESKNNRLTFHSNSYIDGEISGISDLEFKNDVKFNTAKAIKAGKINLKNAGSVTLENDLTFDPASFQSQAENVLLAVSGSSEKIDFGSGVINLDAHNLTLTKQAKAGTLVINTELENISGGSHNNGKILKNPISTQNPIKINLRVKEDVLPRDGESGVIIENINETQYQEAILNTRNIGELFTISKIRGANSQLGFKVKREKLTDILNSSTAGAEIAQANTEENKVSFDIAKALDSAFNSDNPSSEVKTWAKHLSKKSSDNINKVFQEISASQDKITSSSTQLDSAKKVAKSRVLTSSTSGLSTGEIARGKTIWGQALINKSKTSRVNTSETKFSSSGGGIMFGGDITTPINSIHGIALYHTRVELGYKNNNSVRLFNNNGVNFYNLFELGKRLQFFASGFANKSSIDSKMEKSLIESKFATANHEVINSGFEIEFSYKLPVFTGSTLKPYTGIDYTNTRPETYRESGAENENITVEQGNNNEVYYNAGIELSTAFIDETDKIIEPYSHIEFNSKIFDKQASSITYIPGLDPIKHSGPNNPSWKFNFGGGINIKSPSVFETSINYDLTLSSRVIDQTGWIKVKINL